MFDKFDVVLWDFDGVLMDSNQTRDLGFQLVLKDYPQHEVDLLMEFHRENGGLSRYVKFRYFFEDIRNESISEREVEKWAKKFSKIMIEKLLSPDLLINETLSFVKENYSKKSMHIVSGSDQEELRQIAKFHNISKFFKTINGSPTPKKKLVKNIFDEFGYSKNRSVLIGDSINDYEAAVENGITFFGYNNPKLKSVSQRYIESFNSLPHE